MPDSTHTCIYDNLDDLCHLTLEGGVEDLDEEHQAGAEHSQGAGQQDQPHGQVWQMGVHEHVPAWGNQDHSSDP